MAVYMDLQIINFKTSKLSFSLKLSIIININENPSFKIDMARQTHFLSICKPMSPCGCSRNCVHRTRQLSAWCLPQRRLQRPLLDPFWNVCSRKHCFHCSLFLSRASGCARRQSRLVGQKYNEFYLLFVWQL